MPGTMDGTAYQAELLKKAKKAYAVRMSRPDLWAVYAEHGGELTVLWPAQDESDLLPGQEALDDAGSVYGFALTTADLVRVLKLVNPELEVLFLKGWAPEQYRLPGEDHEARLDMLRKGLRLGFMGHRTRAIAGSELETLILESLQENPVGAMPDDADRRRYLEWALEGDRLHDFVMETVDAETTMTAWWDALAGRVGDLAQMYLDEKTGG